MNLISKLCPPKHTTGILYLVIKTSGIEHTRWIEGGGRSWVEPGLPQTSYTHRQPSLVENGLGSRLIIRLCLCHHARLEQQIENTNANECPDLCLLEHESFFSRNRSHYATWTQAYIHTICTYFQREVYSLQWVVYVCMQSAKFCKKPLQSYMDPHVHCDQPHST